MLSGDAMYFAAWVATMIIYVWGAIYAVGRLEGELNGIGRRLDDVKNDLQMLTKRFADLERAVRKEAGKEKTAYGGNQDFRSS
jgi:hypothetical protein